MLILFLNLILYIIFLCFEVLNATFQASVYVTIATIAIYSTVRNFF